MSTYTVVTYPADVLPKDLEPLVYDHWLKSLRHGNDFFKLIDPPKAFYETYHGYISAILHRGDTVIRMAVLTDDKDVVLGFSVSRGTILDYVYVKKEQRRQGIGANLIPPKIETITHLTKTGMTIWGSKYGSWKFNPFA